MKRPLRNLSPAKQHELDVYVGIIEESFAKAVSTRQADRLKKGRILKIILYGSYARGDWVHDPVGRYFSDFDLLVVVDHDDLTDAEFWAEAHAQMMEQASLSSTRTLAEMIVHSVNDVNWKLEHGWPFFIDIIRDGITLKDTPGVIFSAPQPLEPTTALEEANKHAADLLGASSRRAELAAFAVSRRFYNEAAFELHQTAEILYQGLLLVLTLYTPKSHNLAHLRNQTEPLIPRLREAWPHETKFQKRCFELLRAAYVKARYSRHYRITEEELAWLTERIEFLREVVLEASEARIAEMRRAAASSSD